MARAALIAIALAAAPAAADPMSIGVEGGTGVGWARRAGGYRDDTTVGLRLGFAAGDLAVVDGALSFDPDHRELALGAGARVRLARAPCWRSRGALYARAQVALVGASHLSSNYDLTAGIGHWGDVPAVSWLHWYAELDAVARVGDYTALAARIDVGVAITSRGFWP